MIKLNIGSNSEKLPDWINMDIQPVEGCVQHDARTPFHYRSDSVNFIFSEHFIEHLTEDEALAFFKECYRMLVPGGVVRTVTFDVIKLFHNTMPDKWPEYSSQLYSGMFSHMEGVQFLNFAIYEGNAHKHMFNPDEMIRILRLAGFSTFVIPEFRQSIYPELQNLEYRCNSDCIVEAIK